MQFFADGTSEVLFPSDGKAFVGATQGNLLRIPPGGSLFALDKVVGEEVACRLGSAALGHRGILLPAGVSRQPGSEFGRGSVKKMEQRR